MTRLKRPLEASETSESLESSDSLDSSSSDLFLALCEATDIADSIVCSEVVLV